MNAGEGILLTCPGCGHEFRVGRALVGRKLPCAHCLRPITVREAGTATVDRLIGRSVGGCRLTKRLGAGALGLVYAGEDLTTGEAVAVKMLGPKLAADQATVTRFLREARFCAAIQHPNLIRVTDCGVDQNVNYLVMELVSGGSLAGLIEEHGAMPWKQTLPIIRDVASALEKAAELKIVHRDVKPANILLTAEGRAKLADLGLAKQHDSGGGQELTMQGMSIGSPTYMSPEQVTNAKDARAPADIYGLGATWYHLVSGQRPFTGASAQMVQIQVLREEPPAVETLVAGLPPGLARLIARMMHKDWRQRPSASEVITEVDRLSDPAKAATVRTTRMASSKKTETSGPPPWVMPLVIVLIAAAVIGALVAFLLR